MFCKNCGKEIDNNSKFCKHCGASVGAEMQQVDSTAQPQYQEPVIQQQNPSEPRPIKKKKPFYKRVWFWIIAILVVLFMTAPSSDQGSSESSKEPQLSESEYKGKCVEIAYDDLARNPESKNGEYFKFTGEVIQVIEHSKKVELRVNVTPVYFGDDHSGDPLYYEDTIFVETSLGEDGNRILEGDIITLYGVCTGLYTYKAITGSQVSIPGLKAAYWEIAG